MNEDIIKTESEDISQRSYIIGIGASAGGLEALVKFFDNMPPDSGMAFVVVQHLSPDYKSLMDELLSRHTEMEIIKIKDGIRVLPNRIYLLPPKKNLTIFNRQLLLTDPDPALPLNLPIDFFFRSLAEDQEEKAVGIILSGTGSDGSRGIQSIKKAGGMVIVQHEQSAKFDGMPRSAIGTGLADYVEIPEKMPEIILSFVTYPLIAGTRKNIKEFSSDETDMTKLIAMLRTSTGVDFSFYKQATIQRRIERRMGMSQALNLKSYLRYINEHPEEIEALYRDMLIGVTRFFRDKDEFDYLRKNVIPALFRNCKDIKTVRAWVAGCSTGEEAFSIAILLYDHMLSLNENYEIKVFATDIDNEAIIKAGQGVYPDGIAADMDPVFLDKYFNKTSEGFRVKRHIRELVIFARQNILKDPPFTKIDIITCRNLLIYLRTKLQKEILSLFHFALKDKGYLFLGSSESVGDASDYFLAEDHSVKVFLHKGQGIPPVRRVLSVPRYSAKNITASNLPDVYGRSNPKKIEAVEKYYQEIINQLSEASVIVNEKGELLETFGEPDKFLKAQLGKVDLNITRMVRSNAALALKTGIRNALKESKKTTYRNIRIYDNDITRGVNMTISPLKSSNHLIVIFNSDIINEKSEDETTFRLDPQSNQQMIELQNEIQLTRENLQAANEELQTYNEELQATNEELLASNEELQSTNEELNSVNEELNTVNAEYQAKIAELLELNTDMDNLLRSTEIGTVFLDKELRIRKFTPGVTLEINLMQQDVGRKISDLAIPLLTDVNKDISHTLRTFEMRERIVQSPSGKWYLFQILPYTNKQGEKDGVIISMINITKQKNAEIAIKKNLDIMKQMLEISPAAQLMTDSSEKMIFANRQAEEWLGFTKNKLKDMFFDSSDLKITDLEGNFISHEKSPASEIKRTKKHIKNYIICFHKENNCKIIFRISGNPVFNDKGMVDAAVFTMDRLTNDKGMYSEEKSFEYIGKRADDNE